MARGRWPRQRRCAHLLVIDQIVVVQLGHDDGVCSDGVGVLGGDDGGALLSTWHARNLACLAVALLLRTRRAGGAPRVEVAPEVSRVGCIIISRIASRYPDIMHRTTPLSGRRTLHGLGIPDDRSARSRSPDRERAGHVAWSTHDATSPDVGSREDHASSVSSDVQCTSQSDPD